MIDNSRHPYGSGRFASPGEVARAGLFRQTPDSVMIGFLRGRPIYYDGMGGILTVAGARSGKLTDQIGYNVVPGICDQTLLILDPKGEIAAISRWQIPDKRYCVYFNPVGMNDQPRHRMNPVGFIRHGSRTLQADVKVFCQNVITKSGGSNSQYFEDRGREFLEAICLTLVKLKGVLTLPDLYEVINLIPGNSERWIAFAFEMHESGYGIAKRIEEEIATSREDSSGGFRGILGEMFKGFAALSDPVLMDAVSPPYDFDIADLCASDRRHNLYLMVPEDFIESWSAVIKAIFVAAKLAKSRAPAAPRQTWILDEVAQLGHFPLVMDLYSIGAGRGIRPWAFVQSMEQFKKLGPGAETIIPSSAACQSYFATRDLPTAEMLSRRLGSQTLNHIDPAKRAAARHARNKAVQDLMNGKDAFEAGLHLAHHGQGIDMPRQVRRNLREPDEILGTPRDRQYLWVDGVTHPVYAERGPYFEQRFMAKRGYFPNFFHPPLDRVRVKTLFGHRWRKVIREPVPAKYADYPQYRDGSWERLE